MKVLFALGNTGKLYDQTRHNVGFMVVDRVAHQDGNAFSEKSKHKAEIAEISSNSEKVLLIKPTTFYNDVGTSLHSIIDFYKVSPEDVMVIHDELALPFGTIRARVGGSDAGNNGIKSVNQHGGKATNRLRIGVGNDKRQLIGDTEFVLGKFSKDETAALSEHVIPKALELIDAFLSGNHTPTSHILL